MALVNFNITADEGTLFGNRESEEDKGLYTAFIILVTFGKSELILIMQFCEMVWDTFHKIMPTDIVKRNIVI